MDSVDEITNSIEDLKISKPEVILCGCIAIPDTHRKRFRYKDKPNPKPFFNFNLYIYKQLRLIRKQLDCDTYRDDLYKRLGSNDNKLKQFISDVEYYLEKKLPPISNEVH